MAQGLDSTKHAERPSHEAIESTGGQATELAETPAQQADHEAMELAKRAQNRLKDNEGKVPGSSLFTK